MGQWVQAVSGMLFQTLLHNEKNLNNTTKLANLIDNPCCGCKAIAAN